MKKKIHRRITALLLSLCIIFSMLTVSFTSVSAGMITNIVTKNWSAIAFELLERTAICAIGMAQNRTDNETTAEVLSWTKRILGGYQGVVNAELLSRTQEISDDLDLLYTTSEDNFNEVNDKLNKISSDIKKQDFNDKRTVVQTFSNSYKQILDRFNNLYDAFYEYGNSPTSDNKEKLKLSFNEIYNNYYYSTDNENSLFIAPMLDTASDDHYGFLNTISTYDNTASLTDKDGEYNVTDPDYWGEVESRDTYLDTMRAYVESEYNFENNVYDSMVLGAREAGIALSFYVQAYRAYVDFNTILINSSPQLTASEKDASIKMINSHFEEYTLKGIRAVNQMYYEHEDVFTTYMRSYDTESVIYIDDYKTESTLTDAYAKQSGADVKSDKIISSSDGNSSFGAYKFKLVNEKDDTTYIIGKNDQREFLVTRCIDENTPELGNYCFSLHTLNLISNTTSNPTGLRCVKGVSDLTNIMNAGNAAYVNQDSNLINNIINELSVYYGVGYVHIAPAQVVAQSNDRDVIKNGNFLLLNTPITWTPDASFGDDDAEMTWANVSMPTPVEISLDAESDLSVISSDDMYVIFKGSPTVNIGVESSSFYPGDAGGEVDAYVDGESIFGKKGGNVASGKALTIKAKPDEDCIITRVVVKDSGGNIIDEVYGDDPADMEIDTYAIEAQPMMEYMPQDENGYYEFVMPVPSQDVTFVVNFEKKDPNLEKHFVTLDDTNSKAQMFFESYDGVSKKSFSAGDEGSICVVPNDPQKNSGTWDKNNTICDGIEVKDSQGSAIEVKDTTNSFYKIKPTEKRYTFIMPDSDVSVKANTSSGNLVSVGYDGTKNSSHYFNNLNCYDYDFATSTNNETWSTKSDLIFKSGDKVSIKPVADTGYCIKEVNVTTLSGDVATQVKFDGTIEFIMPDEDVTVTIFDESDTDSNYTAKLTGNGANSISFVDDKYDSFNTVSRYYKSGETVYFTVDEANATATIKTADGKTVENVTLEKISEQGNKNTYKFTMPAYNVVIDIYVKPTLVAETTDISICKGKTDRVNVEVLPETLVNKELIWESSDENVATVDDSGLITAVNTGTAVIKATLKSDSEIFIQINVTVDTLVPNKDGIYVIENYAQLCSMRDYINTGDKNYTNATYVLGKDITCPKQDSWAPITKEFNGVFDGKNHSISGLKITSYETVKDYDEDYEIDINTGFFISIGESGVVKNINFDNFCVDIVYEEEYNDPVYIGGITSNNYGTISNCILSGEIVFNKNVVVEDSNLAIGAIASYNFNKIVDCVNNCNITAEGFNDVIYIGGLVGASTNDAIIENSTNNGTITSTAIMNVIGGILGLSLGGGITGSDAGCIKLTANKGKICTNGYGYIGGIYGSDMNLFGESIKITDCYNEGDIDINLFTTDNVKYKALYERELSENLTLDHAMSGGILGLSMNLNLGFEITNCYNVGAISVDNSKRYNLYGTQNFGDIVNIGNIVNIVNIVNSYYLVPDTSSNTETSAKTKSQFKSGEVAYLLNNDVTDGTQIWYQNIDYKEPYDNYPHFNKTDNNTVYKVDQTDKTYSNDQNYVPCIFDTDEYGNFIIRTYDDLCTMAEMVNSGENEYIYGSYVLANDIDCKGRQALTAAIGTSKTSFRGTFDGQGYTISDLNLDCEDKNHIGLFGFNQGTIKNLKLSRCNVSGNDSVGGICGTNYGTIENVSFDGGVSGNENVGGICGDSNEGNIIHCSNTATVSSESYAVGGICGVSFDANITDCYNKGNVSGTTYVGGICGILYDASKTSSCYNTGTVEGTTEVGPICGVIFGSINNCYYLGTSETDSDDGTEFKTAEQFASGEVASLLNKGVTDGTQAWYQNLDNGEIPNLHPTLTNNDKNTVYTIPSQKGYSNYQHEGKASVLERVDLRTYQRVINPDGTFSKDSTYYYGFGLVNNDTKELTLFVLDTAERIGILRHQGSDENHTAGEMLLLGDYPKLDVTSKELLESGQAEPDIYTDKNYCIFIKIPENGEIPPLKVKYTEKPTNEYTPTEYTLKIEVVDSSYFKTVGASRTSTLSKDDPNYAVFEAEQAYANALKASPQQTTNSTKDPSKSVTTNSTTIKTGSPLYYGLALLIIFATLAFIIVYKRKRKTFK